MTVRVIPCLLLQRGGLVKTIRFEKPTYIGDPINAVKIFNDKQVDELILLDIEASKSHGRPEFAFLEQLTSECFMPVCYGGGIRTIDDMKTLFSLGIEKVALNTIAVEQPDIVREAADRFGSSSVVVSIDVRKHLLGKYEVMTNGGMQKTGLHPLRHAQHVEALGAGEIMLTAIDRDGTMEGYDIPLMSLVSNSVSIPLIASGGASSVADFVMAVRGGHASAVAAGSMFVFHGPHRAVLINYPSVQELRSAFAKGS